jgi:DnaJ-class molecular chaperone
MAGALLILAAIACGACYYVSLRIWPETKCGRCDGSGHNRGSNAKRFGKCKPCAGTGRKPRAGTRVLERNRRT